MRLPETNPTIAPTDRPAPSWLGDLWLDLRFGARALRRAPGFVFATAGTLALGLGGATAILNLVTAILLNPLPNEGGDRLVVLAQDQRAAGRHGLGFSVPELDDYRRALSSVEAVVEHHSMTFNLLGQGEPREVKTGVVDDRYFAAMGLRPVLGRFFTAEENAMVGNAVLVLSNQYWRTHLGADPTVIGRRFVMNGLVHTVVGVLPPVARFPTDDDIYVPTSQCPVRSNPGFKSNRAARMMTALVRLRPGADLGTLASEIDVATRRIQQANPAAYPSGVDQQVTLTPLKTAVIGDATRPLVLLLGATVLVLLVAASNVAGLQLTRLAGREQELAIRIALGAGTGRLARQLVAESTLIALLGGGVGMVLAARVMEPLKTFAARFTPRAAETTMGLQLIGLGIGLSLLTGALVGIVATLSVRHRVIGALRGGVGMSSDATKQRMLATTVVVQLSFAFVMLVGAGLLLRSLWLVSNVDPGFAVDHVITMRVVTPIGGYQTLATQRSLWNPIIEGLRRRPGVIAVSAGTSIPLGSASTLPIGFEIRGHEIRSPGDLALAQVQIAATDYFKALGIPLRRGRPFDDRDEAATEQVVVVNDAFVKRYFGAADPLGAVLVPCDFQSHCDPAGQVRIVGVVGDVAQDALDVAPAPEVYGPALQSNGFGSNLIIRTAGDPADLSRFAIDLVHSIDPNLPVEDVRSMTAVRDGSLAPRRLMALLLSLFAGLAGIVAGAGVIAMTAFAVAQRQREIGIRLALGAGAGNVVALISTFAFRAIAASLVIGGLVATGLSRSLAGLLWGIGSFDLATYLIAATVLAGGTAIAAWTTARRAGRVDPVRLIRGQ